MTWVKGWSRVPRPPARMTACINYVKGTTLQMEDRSGVDQLAARRGAQFVLRALCGQSPFTASRFLPRRRSQKHPANVFGGRVCTSSHYLRGGETWSGSLCRARPRGGDSIERRMRSVRESWGHLDGTSRVPSRVDTCLSAMIVAGVGHFSGRMEAGPCLGRCWIYWQPFGPRITRRKIGRTSYHLRQLQLRPAVVHRGMPV